MRLPMFNLFTTDVDALLKSLVMIRDKRIRISDYVEAEPTELLAAVREQQLEDIVGKRKDTDRALGKIGQRFYDVRKLFVERLHSARKEGSRNCQT